MTANVARTLGALVVWLCGCGGANYSEELANVGADAGFHADDPEPDAGQVTDPPQTVDAGSADSDPQRLDAGATSLDAAPTNDADPPDVEDVGATDAADSCVPLTQSVACAIVVSDAGNTCDGLSAPASPMPTCGRICGMVSNGCGGTISCGNPCQDPLQCFSCANGGTSYGMTVSACSTGCQP